MPQKCSISSWNAPKGLSNNYGEWSLWSSLQYQDWWTHRHSRTGNLTFVGETRNVFIKRHDALTSLKHFSKMFQNSGNKIRLQEIFKMEFKSNQGQHPDWTILYSVWECCCDLSTDEEMCELTCQHMEPDTILFFIYSLIRRSRMSDAVVIDWWPLGPKRKNNILDCSTLLHKDIADVIIPFHVHTGADTLSIFFVHGKPSVFESAMKSQETLKLLPGLWKSLPVTSQTKKDKEKFTIKYVYKDNTSETLAEARAKKCDEMKRKSTLRIPHPTLIPIIWK